MLRSISCCVIVGTILSGPPAQATNERIAVLPLDIRHTAGKLNADAQAFLEEMLRDVAANTLSQSGRTMLTGEATLQALHDNGVHASKCGDQNCHLRMARKLKVDKFISGAVEYVDGVFTASIRLIDVKTGGILASVELDGKNVIELRKEFKGKATEFLARAGMDADVAPRAASRTGGQSQSEPSNSSLGAKGQTLAVKQRACHRGDAAACTDLATQYAEGTGVPKDEGRAAALYKQACDGGDANGCLDLAASYEFGLGVAKDYNRAAALYKQACDGGSTSGCEALGVMYRDGDEIPKDEAQAVALFRRGCDRGDPYECGLLGLMYEHGEGVAQDKPQAAALYKQACDGGEASACNYLREITAKGNESERGSHEEEARPQQEQVGRDQTDDHPEAQTQERDDEENLRERREGQADDDARNPALNNGSEQGSSSIGAGSSTDTIGQAQRNGDAQSAAIRAQISQEQSARAEQQRQHECARRAQERAACTQASDQRCDSQSEACHRSCDARYKPIAAGYTPCHDGCNDGVLQCEAAGGRACPQDCSVSASGAMR